MGGSATLQMVARARRSAGRNGKLHEPNPFYLAMLQALSPIWEDLQPYKWLPGLEGLQDVMASCMSQVHFILQGPEPCHP